MKALNSADLATTFSLRANDNDAKIGHIDKLVASERIIPSSPPFIPVGMFDWTRGNSTLSLSSPSPCPPKTGGGGGGNIQIATNSPRPDHTHLTGEGSWVSMVVGCATPPPLDSGQIVCVDEGGRGGGWAGDGEWRR